MTRQQRSGHIVALRDGIATVSIASPAACASCGSRSACAGSRTIELPAPAGARPGAAVTVAVADEALLRSALLAYFLPTVATLLGAVACAGFGDAAAVAGAACGLGSGLLGMRLLAVPPAPTIDLQPLGEAP
jgi:positive regulator of sigma E activity